MDINMFSNALSVNSKMLNIREGELNALLISKEEIQKKSQVLKETRVVLAELSKISREKAVNVIQDTVSNMLKETLGDRYNFEVELSESGGRPTVEFYVIKTVDGIQSRQNISEDNGGGVLDIVSTALRYAFLLVYNKGIKSPLILDEPAKMISENNAPMYVDFLAELSNYSGKQVIMCTHNEAIKDRADNLIVVKNTDGKSKITYK